jgi:hypothetical protein
MASRGAKPMACTKPSNCRPVLTGRQTALDLLVAADVAVKNQPGAELGGKFGDAVLEALAHVAEGQLGALLRGRLGNAVGDGAVGQHAGDQEFLACQKAHGVLIEMRCSSKSAQNCRMRAIGGRAAGGVGCRRLGGARLCAVGRPEVPARALPLRLRQPGAQGRRAALVSNLARVHLRQVQPLHAQGQRAGLPGRLLFDSLLAGSLDETGAAYGLLAEDVTCGARPAVGHLPHAPRGALPQRRPGAGGRREAQLRDADGTASTLARLPHLAGRRGGGGRARRAHGALPLQEAQPRAAADGGRPAGVQPPSGAAGRQGQAFRPGGDGHAHRQRFLQASARCASARTSPTCATRLTGRATCRSAGHGQLRPHHGQDLQGQHRAAGGAQGR